MARPQKITDDELFAAAYRVMNRVGPAECTLSAIAEEAGVTAGLLVQRFGSKHALQVRLAEAAATHSINMVEQFRAQHKTSVGALRAYVECMAGLASSPDAMVRSLAYLTEDLADPALRAHLTRQGEATRGSLEAIIRDGIARGEFVETTKPRSLARTIEAIVPGAMLTWATYRDGPAAKWMRRELDSVLKPYLLL